MTALPRRYGIPDGLRQAGRTASVSAAIDGRCGTLVEVKAEGTREKPPRQ